MLQYIYCFNRVKLGLLRKQSYIHINIIRKNKIIIELLLKYNIILGYKIISNNENRFFKVYLNNKINYFNIKNLFKITSFRVFRLKTLLKLKNKNTCSKYIFSTNIGFIDLQEAIDKKKGGILMFKIY